MSSDIGQWLKADGEEFFRSLGIKPGQSVLDFGCSAGRHTIPVAKVVGQSGIVYAFDKNRSDLCRLRREAKSEGIDNIMTLEVSKRIAVSLEEGSIDVVLLFDVLHYMTADDRRLLYGEVHRVLREDGRLLVYPKHVKSDQPLWYLRDIGLDEVIEEIEISDFYLEGKSTKWLLHDDAYDEGMVLWFRKQGRI